LRRLCTFWCIRLDRSIDRCHTRYLSSKRRICYLDRPVHLCTRCCLCSFARRDHLHRLRRCHNLKPFCKVCIFHLHKPGHHCIRTSYCTSPLKMGTRYRWHFCHHP
jgi:hypothetical protein